ncbi:hypothetical protein [Sphingomonas sp. Leaf357]|uniref:hypothetical protein n=1 Tax=Sphingomonas sp. Leaf357 TaxID=1736350 RepID=UPI000AF01BA5|nr:hypothetical protein [Sphingomonas sp. Leaf357]
MNANTSAEQGGFISLALASTSAVCAATSRPDRCRARRAELDRGQLETGRSARRSR